MILFSSFFLSCLEIFTVYLCCLLPGTINSIEQIRLLKGDIYKYEYMSLWNQVPDSHPIIKFLRVTSTKEIL